MTYSHIGGEPRESFKDLEETFKVIESFMGYLPNSHLSMAKNPNLNHGFSALASTIFGSKHLGIDLVNDTDIEEDIIKKINSKYKIGKLKGINIILLEGKEDNEVYINGYGRKKKMLKTNPTVIVFKNNDKFYKINKEKKDKSVDIFKTDSTFISKLIDKYNLK